MKFTITKDGFYFDGKKTKIISGAMHYFRIFPEYWEDRLLKLKELGANCVETYSAWNLHEKEEGKWDFSDRLDLVKFIETAKKLGLMVILRPGPYICSECDMGGLPWWLLKYDDIELRAYNKRFLEKAEIYLNKIFSIVNPHLITNGGNVIMVQIENEYGAFGNDKRYLSALKEIYVKNGVDVPYFTCDWEGLDTLTNGHIDGVIPFVNYRWDSETALNKLKSFSPDTPSGVMELWNGKALLGDGATPKRDLNEIEVSVKGALKKGELMNLYMFHGGTNFGFFNGSQYNNGKFMVHATSYDVQTPLGEYGNKTEKYYLEQKIICDYLGKEIVNQAKTPTLINYGELNLKSITALSRLGKENYKVNYSKHPLNMEKYDQAHGLIAYTKDIDFKGKTLIELPAVHDKCKAYIDNELVYSVERDGDNKFSVDISGNKKLTLLVEEWGRINFDHEIYDKKGLVGDVLLNGETLTDWTVYSYSLDCPKTLENADGDGAKFYKYEISLSPNGDTYLEIDGFNHGVVYINGFILGRYWSDTAQKSFYIPNRLLTNGTNEVVVLDLEPNADKKTVKLSGKQIILGYAE